MFASYAAVANIFLFCGINAISKIVSLWFGWVAKSIFYFSISKSVIDPSKNAQNMPGFP